jgi:hypothetical protein
VDFDTPSAFDETGYPGKSFHSKDNYLAAQISQTDTDNF